MNGGFEMIKTKLIKNFPEYAVNFAYYGEDETLSEKEKKEIQKFMDEFYFIEVVPYSENGFCKYPAFGLSCRTVSILVEVKN
jgi:hypothetical protein